MAPEVGRSSPASRLSNADLPEPELPSSARNSPARTSRETSLTAWMRVSPSLYWREAFSALIWVVASVWVGIVGPALGLHIVIRAKGIGYFAVGRETRDRGGEAASRKRRRGVVALRAE